LPAQAIGARLGADHHGSDLASNQSPGHWCSAGNFAGEKDQDTQQ
jgi:hypothetical protein